MKAIACLLLACAPAITFAAGDTKTDLEGKWTIEKDRRPLILHFDGGKLHATNRHGTQTSGFRVRVNREGVAEIDIDGDRGLQKGIYRVDGDSLQLAIQAPGADRPKEFNLNRDINEMRFLFKRTK
jgi:uncharacterized protein (TIGR03067 family)